MPSHIAQIVLSMQSVSLSVQGFQRTLWDFYFGFGILLSVFLCFNGLSILWLDSVIVQHPKIAKQMTSPLIMCYGVVAGIAWWYFFPVPAVVTTTVTLLLLIGALRINIPRKLKR